MRGTTRPADRAATAVAAARAHGCTCPEVEVVTTPAAPGVELITIGHLDGCPLIEGDR